MNNTVEIMNVRINRITLQESLRFVQKRFSANETTFIATPNPEMLLAARKNQKFKEILNKTDLNIPDGTGVVFASKFTNKPLKERVTGTDLMLEICKINHEGLKIFLLGAAEGVAQKTAEILNKKYQTNIVGYSSGNSTTENYSNLCNQINKSGANVLFVAFGAPKQEMWLSENLKKLHKIKIAMGIGGAFDFISEKKKRAPGFLRAIGLEWLFRVIIEPKRINRIFNATIKFPLLLLKDAAIKRE